MVADGVRRLLVHADAFGGMVDDDGQVFVFEVLVEQVAQLGLGPDQMHTHRQSPAREDGPANLGLGCFIGTYGVQRDVNEHGRSRVYLAASLMSRTARPL